MSDYDFLPASDGTGDAALMHIQSVRLAAATTIDVDTVENVPSKFIATYGTLLPSGLIDPTTKRDFKGHVSGADLIIDSFEPGNVDAGNVAGQVVIIKPNVGWANRVAAFAKNFTGKGTPEDATVDDLAVGGALTVAGDETVTGTLTANGPTVLAGAVSGAGFDTKNLKNSYKFLVYAAGSMNILATPTTGMPFDSKDYDTGNNVDVTVHKGRFTAPIAGFYHFDTTGYCQSLTGNAYIGFAKNGTILAIGGLSAQSSGGSVAITCSETFQLAANDYIEVFAYNTQGTRDWLGTRQNSRFSGFLLSKT